MKRLKFLDWGLNQTESAPVFFASLILFAVIFFVVILLLFIPFVLFGPIVGIPFIAVVSGVYVYVNYKRSTSSR